MEGGEVRSVVALKPGVGDHTPEKFADHEKTSAAVSVSLRGKRRFSDVNVERGRLLHHYPLHRANADAQRLADLQYARAAPVEAQDSFCNSALPCPSALHLRFARRPFYFRDLA
jgi:hypothetical protein